MLKCYDPDGYIVEIGATMEAVVWRFYGQGWTIDCIHEKTAMPGVFIEQAIQKHSGAGQANR